MSDDQREIDVSSPCRFSELSVGRQALVRLFRRVGFGTVRGLVVRGAEPVLEHGIATQQVLLLGRGGSETQRAETDDFVLRREILDLFTLFDRRGSLVVAELEIAAGLPRRVTIAASELPR